MMTILHTITEHKRVEVLKRKGRKPLEELQKKPFYEAETLNPHDFFTPGVPGIIAEFKRKSPSKGMLARGFVDPVKVVRGYKEGGASCASVLTDRDFFGGSFRDLEEVKHHVGNIPLLRKDFMIDPYQVHEAKAYGADIILLIAAILEKDEVKSLAELASSLGLSVLLEVHTEEELEKWVPGITMVGVNNRDLKDFGVDIQRSLDLVEKMPAEALKISESGLGTREDIAMLFDAGFNGFLMGERFMTGEVPGDELKEFIKQLNQHG